MVNAYIQAESLVQGFWSLEKQGRSLGNDIAQVIGQAAICITYVLTALKNYDFGLFVKATQTCSG